MVPHFGLTHDDAVCPATSAISVELPKERNVYFRAVDRFRQVFNCERPHEGLNNATRGSVYQPGPVLLPRNPIEFVYPRGFLLRRVNNSGDISCHLATFGAKTCRRSWQPSRASLHSVKARSLVHLCRDILHLNGNEMTHTQFRVRGVVFHILSPDPTNLMRIGAIDCSSRTGRNRVQVTLGPSRTRAKRRFAASAFP
jgi:hypothetical protein